MVLPYRIVFDIKRRTKWILYNINALAAGQLLCFRRRLRNSPVIAVGISMIWKPWRSMSGKSSRRMSRIWTGNTGRKNREQNERRTDYISALLAAPRLKPTRIR